MLEKLETKVWDPDNQLKDAQIDQFLVVARLVNRPLSPVLFQSVNIAASSDVGPHTTVPLLHGGCKKTMHGGCI